VKNYQGGKKIFLKIEGIIAEEIYYKRLDAKRIVEKKFKNVIVDNKGRLLRRKLFVRGEDEEREYVYKYLTEDGKIYEGERRKAILDCENGKIIYPDGRRFLEFIKFADLKEKEKYLIEDSYCFYNITENSNLYYLAKRLYNNGECAIFKFNPQGDITGLGFLYAVKKDDSYALICDYARLLKTNHLIFLQEGTKKENVKSVEFIEGLEEKKEEKKIKIRKRKEVKCQIIS